MNESTNSMTKSARRVDDNAHSFISLAQSLSELVATFKIK